MSGPEYLAAADDHLAVIGGTLIGPQSAIGIPVLAVSVMKNIVNENYTGEEFSRGRIEDHPGQFEGMQLVTAGVHMIVGRPVFEGGEAPDPANATKFSDRITRAAIRAGVFSFADGKRRRGLYLPTEEDHQRFGDITNAHGTAAKLMDVFGFASDIVLKAGGDVGAEADQFKKNLKANYANYVAREVPKDEYLDRKYKLQQGIGRAVNRLVLKELATQPDILRGVRSKARAALTSLFTAMPDRSLVGAFFGKNAQGD